MNTSAFKGSFNYSQALYYSEAGSVQFVDVNKLNKREEEEEKEEEEEEGEEEEYMKSL